ncbi:hypothetical protein COO60DRAFT_1112681 [Scenedesmus sp. NREL 46B-D3]|nr:hypothetical protein COO60DRAFT_1112681 [Scenedesmus sp. NREL 46B-D3]
MQQQQTGWHPCQQQQQHAVLQEMILQQLPEPTQQEQQQQQLLGSFSCCLAGDPGAAGMLYLTGSCLAFTNIFSSSSSSSSSSSGNAPAGLDTTKVMPLHSLLRVALVAPAATSAAAAVQQQQQHSAATAGAAGGAVSRRSTACTVSSRESFRSLSAASYDDAHDASAAGAAADASSGGWLQLLSNSVKRLRSDAPAAAAAAAPAPATHDFALQLVVLAQPGVQELLQFEDFAAGELQRLLSLLRRAQLGAAAAWQPEGLLAADAVLSGAAAAAAVTGALPAATQQQQQRRRLAGEAAAGGAEPAALRCVRCCLHGALANTPGKLLLLKGRLEFVAAAGEVSPSSSAPSPPQQQIRAAGDGSSSSTGSVLAALPLAAVEAATVRQGWLGSWLVVAGGGRQLLLGGLQAEAAEGMRADVLQRAAELRSRQ